MNGKNDLTSLKSGGVYKVVWPGGKKAAAKTDFYANRLSSLNDQTICMLWNGRFRGDEIFILLEKGLLKRYPRVKTVSWTEFPRDGEHGVPDWKKHSELLTEKGCDAVMVATGA